MTHHPHHANSRDPEPDADGARRREEGAAAMGHPDREPTLPVRVGKYVVDVPLSSLIDQMRDEFEDNDGNGEE